MARKNPGSDSRKTALQKPSGLCYLIGRLDHALSRRMRDCLAPIGLTTSQYTALSFLAAHGRMSNAQLAERSLTSPQAANEMVKMMESRGWIEKQPDESHGRIVQISVTGQGKDILRQCDAAILRLETAMLNGMPVEDCQALQNQLRSLLSELTTMMVNPTPI
ncbi:MAG TPA: MarR family transcriptional regulator [Rhodocyclaceae bacterium]|nr:MarR family transcriptional regulator [Rhodocyclaceae bacterium]